MNATASDLAAKLGDSKSSPQIFKLNVDCFEHLFEWLSLDELLAFRCTCKRMKAVVDYYIRLNYPRLLRLCIKNRQTLTDLSDTRLNYYEWIRHLYIWTIGLNDTHIEGIKYILDQLETLKLCWVQIAGDFYETLLKYCPHLKYLGVTTDTVPDTIIGTGNEWLRRRYPTLEHFEIEIRLSRDEPFQCTELLEFFEQNPNIRIFSMDSAFLLTSHQLLLGSEMKLDRLDIYVNHELNLICNLTNELYKNAFYQQLHLYNSRKLYQNLAHHLWTFSNIEKLNFYSLPDDFHIPPTVASIKKLSIHMCSLLPLDMPEMMATSFTNLRQIEIQYARVHEIRPFICHAIKLKEIKVWKLLTDNADEPKLRDFIALDREREQLENQTRKVTIFIDEKSFMRMKWASTLTFSSIELKQIESCELDHLFNWIV